MSMDATRDRQTWQLLTEGAENDHLTSGVVIE